MAGKDGFSKLERKAYLSYHQDGLIDIIIGLCTVGFAVNMLADNATFTILGWMPVLFFAPLKNWITIPRVSVTSDLIRPSRGPRERPAW